MRWLLERMSEGLYPLAKELGIPWVIDSIRHNMGGKSMKGKFALIWNKCDWAEFCERFGFPTWQSVLRPCFICATSPDDMYRLAHECNPVEIPWYENEDDDYEDACKKCEFYVHIPDQATHAELLNRLHYDERPSGAFGRCMKRDYPHLGLRIGDRLEPNQRLPDVGKFDDMIIPDGGKAVLFWRVGNETICLRRCPLFDRPSSMIIGLTPKRCLAIDIMHTLYLGPMQNLCMHIMWKILMSGLWGSFGPTEHERIRIACRMMRHQLFRFYERYQRDHPDKPLTRLSDLTTKMIGKYNDQKLKMKAMEIWGFLLFLISILEDHDGILGDEHDHLLLAAYQIQAYVEWIKDKPCQLNAETLQE